jgi:hypothetical protein
MGFRFRKSFKVGGVRINLSKSGVGASVGGKGLRVGVGPRGGRVTASLPGSGLSYSVGTRAARQRQQQLAGSMSGRSDFHGLELYENQIELLTSLHREPVYPWDWSEVAVAPDPPLASDASRHAAQAIGRQTAYDPGLFARLFGKAQKTRRMLAAELEAARQLDAEEQAAEVERLAWLRPVAAGILDGVPEACATALEHLPRLDEVRELASALDIRIVRPWCVEACFTALGDDVVPHEVKTLTKAGNVSTKQMGVTQHWAIYQDYLCSAAIRIAREVFAVLPAPVCLVHVAIPLLDTRVGHVADTIVISAAFEQATLESLNVEAIDPSDAMTLFEQRTEFLKTKGFRPVEPLTPDDFDAEG